MAEKMKMILNLFEGGAAGASAAPAGDGAGEGTGEAAVTPGVLQDGTQVDDRLAARMKEQARKRKARGEADVQIAPQQAQQAEAQPQEQAEPSLEDQWKELKKGKFKELYSRDVRDSIQDRFKNQQDAGQQLNALEPGLKVLRERAGVETNEELMKHILDDDSLYEEAANEAGMTVSAYKTMMQIKAQNEEYQRKEQQAEEERQLQEHYRDLSMQAEELKKIYPGFDLQTELENPKFFRMTMPGSGLSVSDAYYALHHAELEPQVMAYGIQRAQQQISQTLQANQQRPVEGAMRTGQPANVSIDPRKMTRAERQNYIERARRGEKITF